MAERGELEACLAGLPGVEVKGKAHAHALTLRPKPARKAE